MRLHALLDEYGIPSPDGHVLVSWCWCGLLYVTSGRTGRRAWRRALRRSRDHRGFAAAAGPGWNGVEL